MVPNPPERLRLLIDTDVLIDYLRGLDAAITWLEGLDGPLSISAITVAELYAGVREGEERRGLELFVEAFDVVGVTDHIAQRGGLIRRDYLKSHGVGLGDALIAATAEHLGVRLATLNHTHFPTLGDIVIPYTKH